MRIEIVPLLSRYTWTQGITLSSEFWADWGLASDSPSARRNRWVGEPETWAPPDYLNNDAYILAHSWTT